MDHEGRIHGHLDPPLSSRGRARAKQIGRSFRNKGVKHIHSSPRQRARETAEEISKHTGAPVTVHPELEPWDVGSMSGAKVNSVRPVLDYFSKHHEKIIPGGESKKDVLDRYSKFSKAMKPGHVLVGHSQHSLAHDFVRKGGDASKVPMIGGKAGEIREVNL